MDFTQTSAVPDLTSSYLIDRLNGVQPGPLTGGTSIAFSTLLAAPDHTASFADLADMYWPQDRPVHWKGLISFYSRWLQERLPAGWTVTEHDEQLQLTVEDGALNHQALLDGVVTELPVESWRPSLSVTADTGATRCVPMPLRDPKDPVAKTAIATNQTRDFGHCGAHRSPQARLPILTRQAHLAVVTYGPHQPTPEPLAWREMLATAGQTPGFVFVAGATPDLPFGDLAAAFAPARWELLEVEGRNKQARVAKAWRIIREHLPADVRSDDGNRYAVVFDAHRLDASSLELAQLLVEFPLADNIRLVFVGDAADPRPGWQDLLRALAESDCPRFEMCATCDPSLLMGHQVDHQTALCG